MSEGYIPDDWLEAVRDRSLFYPGAGLDLEEPLRYFGGYISTFVFTDISYDRQMKLRPLSRESWLLRHSELIGNADCDMEPRSDNEGRQFRFLEPSILAEIYRRSDGREITVRRRRGFGQYALTAETFPGSIGLFCFRGDCPVSGEASSGIRYISNSTRRHEPLSMLWSKLSERMSDRALVVTDGSNADPSFLRAHYNRAVDGLTAAKNFGCRVYNWGGWSWECVGYIGPKYGPTLIWGVTRATQGKA